MINLDNSIELEKLFFSFISSISFLYNLYEGNSFSIRKYPTILLLSNAITDDVMSNLDNSGNTSSYYRDWLAKDGVMIDGTL